MDEFVQKVKLQFEADNKSIEESEKKVKTTFKDLTKEFSKGFGFDVKKFDGKMFANSMGKALGNVFNAFLDGLKQTFADAWKELKNMLSYSQLTSGRTRELAFGYGFNASQAYGFDKALNILGISEEDMFYMNPQQKKQFQELFSKYTEKYSKLYDAGFFERLQEFTVEFEDFKQEVMMEVVEFFMDNRNTIMTVMKASMEFFEFTIKALGFIVQGLSGDYSKTDSQRDAATADIISSYSISNSKTINVKQDNTYNNVDNESKAWLQNSSNTSYQQIIAALS